jgi:hypothetical protein
MVSMSYVVDIEINPIVISSLRFPVLKTKELWNFPLVRAGAGFPAQKQDSGVGEYFRQRLGDDILF